MPYEVILTKPGGDREQVTLGEYAHRKRTQKNPGRARLVHVRRSVAPQAPMFRLINGGHQHDGEEPEES